MASRSRRGSAASEHAGETNKGGDAQHVCVAVRVRPLNANELRANASTVVGVAGSSITLVDPISLEYTGVGAAAIAQHSALPRAGAMVAPAFHAGMDVPRRTFTFNHVFHREFRTPFVAVRDHTPLTARCTVAPIRRCEPAERV